VATAWPVFNVRDFLEVSAPLMPTDSYLFLCWISVAAIGMLTIRQLSVQTVPGSIPTDDTNINVKSNEKAYISLMTNINVIGE
jgi:hypothetical protein